MNIKKHIPNFLTCCNLFCGCIGIIEIFKDNIVTASYLIFLACVFDFLDGFAARILKVTSDIGKELDSLADVVTFGVLPGFIIYHLFFLETNQITAVAKKMNMAVTSAMINGDQMLLLAFPWLFTFFACLIPVFSALRLAKFNIDTRQSESFIGVPTPTNAILIASFPLILSENKFSWFSEIILNPYFLIIFTVVMSYLLVAELPLFALKFKNFKWADNKIRFTFMGLSVVLFVLLLWTAIPIIIFLYIILSFIENKLLKPKNSH